MGAPIKNTLTRCSGAALVAAALLSPISPAHAGAAVAAKPPGERADSGLRALPRASRHALIIGVGQYITPGIPELKGIRYDVESASQMARSMQIPLENIKVLRDHEATAGAIEREIAALNQRTRPGDRVFFYFSGHGSRWFDASVNKNGCVEALLPADGLPLTNERIATILKPISDKTDKLFVFYDACHSGGIVDRPMATMRSMRAGTNTLTPKFSSAGASDQCAKPANMKTRSFTTEAVNTGGLPQNIVQISSSRPDEVSFDDETGGGLATQAWRDCMLGETKDLDKSGSISVTELAACAQTRIDARFANSAVFAAQHVTLGGNASFIPSWFASAFAPQSGGGASTAGSPESAFTDIMAQRDPRRTVTVQAPAKLDIGKDYLDISLTSSHAGHVYLVMLGSDNKSYYLLFPNEKDHNNAIKAGETLTLPRPDWRIKALGPAGTDRMLTIVTESPRNLALLGAGRAGPFLQTLTDGAGRANLSWILGTGMYQAAPECKDGGVSRNAGAVSKCSDAFGAALTTIIEQ